MPFPAGRHDVRAAVQASRRQQHPGPGQLLDEPAHLGVQLHIRRATPPLTVIKNRNFGLLGEVPPCPSGRSRSERGSRSVRCRGWLVANTRDLAP